MMTEPTPDAPMNTDSNANTNTNMETNESPMMNPMENVNAAMESGGGEAMESRNGSGEAMMAGEEIPMSEEENLGTEKTRYHSHTFQVRAVAQRVWKKITARDPQAAIESGIGLSSL